MARDFVGLCLWPGAPEAVRGCTAKGTPVALNTAHHRFMLRGVIMDYAGASCISGGTAALVDQARTLEVQSRRVANGQVLLADSGVFRNQPHARVTVVKHFAGLSPGGPQGSARIDPF